MTERYCPICKVKLAEGNPNKYCFAHIAKYAQVDIDEKQDNDVINRNKATVKYHRKMAKLKLSRGRKDEKGMREL